MTFLSLEIFNFFPSLDFEKNHSEILAYIFISLKDTRRKIIGRDYGKMNSDFTFETIVHDFIFPIFTKVLHCFYICDFIIGDFIN